jgi:hypothetical protein
LIFEFKSFVSTKEMPARILELEPVEETDANNEYQQQHHSLNMEAKAAQKLLVILPKQFIL